MPHLIRSLFATPDKLLSIQEVCQQLRAAHDYLALQGQLALERARFIVPDIAWGVQVKRIRVALPALNKPALVLEEAEHNLVEVINQCATLERLIDALEWADINLPDFSVLLCHPTTSSEKEKTQADNDLILVNGIGERARFEVSDVVGSRDTNQKAAKDITSLQRGGLPSDKLYLVVSAELSALIQRQKSKSTHMCQSVIDEGSTHIFQIILKNMT
jgi:hypothetical protein